MNSNELFKKYIDTKDSKIREELIVMHIPIVKIVVSRIFHNYSSKIEYNDLVSYGIFGLIDAIDKFDPSKGVKFETYAQIRIRGAIIDNIRSLDWIPRSVRKMSKDIERAYDFLEGSLGRTPSDDEVAKYLDITPDKLNKHLSEINTTVIVSLDEIINGNSDIDYDTDRDTNPGTRIEEEEVREALSKSIDSLNDKERDIVTLYYYEELTYKEISQLLNISESRISQIHTKAIIKLKNRLVKYR